MAEAVARFGLVAVVGADHVDVLASELARAGEDISVSALAEVARLSPFHFSRAFKESMGAPPHRFFMSRRTERAKNLLADPELSVTRIGQELGFSETRAFTTTFRRHSGLTPTAHRRSLG